jgi:hypothetical protein
MVCIITVAKVASTWFGKLITRNLIRCQPFGDGLALSHETLRFYSCTMEAEGSSQPKSNILPNIETSQQSWSATSWSYFSAHITGFRHNWGWEKAGNAWLQATSPQLVVGRPVSMLASNCSALCSRAPQLSPGTEMRSWTEVYLDLG